MPSGTNGEFTIRDRSSLALAKSPRFPPARNPARNSLHSLPISMQYCPSILLSFKYHPHHLQLPSDPISFYVSRSISSTDALCIITHPTLLDPLLHNSMTNF